MIVRIEKDFQKDLSKLNDTKLNVQVSELIGKLRSSSRLSALSNIKKMSGYKDFYRIRIGNYRVGVKYTTTEEIILLRILHRKDVYKKWP